ncbi:MAG: hypothetical protein ACJASQ_001620 [Crocinitomicaceae bacterium]|jgi:uncharacterized protein (TIGR02391 family)
MPINQTTKTVKKEFPSIDGSVLEGIAKALGDTNRGLTGPEIDKFILEAKLINVDPGITKWKRLFNSFVEFQNRKKFSNNILTFITKSMNPARYMGDKERFDLLRDELNKRLGFIGYFLTEEGRLTNTSSTTTISEAEQRINRLKSKLENRNCHEKIFEFCIAELVAENYFHTVFEATKSIAEVMRNKTGLTSDGSALVDTCFSLSNPLIQINDLSTETKQSEHKGFANLIRGVFGMFRNTTAHAPSVIWQIDEEDALDILSTISLIHRKLDY